MRADRQRDKQRYKQTDKLITMLRTAVGHEVTSRFSASDSFY